MDSSTLLSARRRLAEYIRPIGNVTAVGSMRNAADGGSPGSESEDIVTILRTPSQKTELMRPPVNVNSMESIILYNSYFLRPKPPSGYASYSKGSNRDLYNGVNDDPYYYVDVKGCVIIPGTSRKTKILGGIVRQMVGNVESDPVRQEQLANEILIDVESDTDSIESGNCSHTNDKPGYNTSTMCGDSVKKRIDTILAKPSVDRIVNITVYRKPDPYTKVNRFEPNQDVPSSLTFRTITKSSGRFAVRIRVPFEPSEATVSIRQFNGDPLTAATVPIGVSDTGGVSVISDLDDTIRNTGITGDKREVLRNILVHDHSKVKIEGVDEWFRTLASAGASFHYVSSSPWQLYPLIHEFLEENGFPRGSIHLKHYSGIFSVNGVLQPSLGKKRAILRKMFKDMPHHKFILIGDSGETDLEAYCEVAKEFPDQVLAVYIRDVFDKPTMSSRSENNLRAQMNHYEILIDLSEPIEPAASPLPPKKPRPPVPRKPVGLQTDKVEHPSPTPAQQASRDNARSQARGIAQDNARFLAQKLATREPTPPPLPQRPATMPAVVPSSQDFNEDIIDKRADMWDSRVARAKTHLGPGVNFKIWKHVRDVQDESVRLVRSI